MTSLTHVEGNADLQVISLNKNKVLTCTGSSHWLKGLTLISAINLLVILQVCILFLLTHMYSQEISFLLLVSVCLLLDLAHILLNIKKIMKPCPFKSESYLHIFVLWSLAEKCFYRLFFFFFYFASWWKTPAKMSVTCHWEQVWNTTTFTFIALKLANQQTLGISTLWLVSYGLKYIIGSCCCGS